MAFAAPALTMAGKTLLHKGLAGETIKFTRIKMGDGILETQNPKELTDLIHTVTDVELVEISQKNEYVTMRGTFSNQELSSGFYWREFGLFAQDPDQGEILYCYSNAGDLAEYITSAETSEIVKKLTACIVIDSAQNIQFEVNSSITYADKAEFDELKQLVNLINNTATYKFVLDFTIPVNTWTNVSDTDRYGWKAEISNGNILQEHIPDITLASESLATAFEAGLCTTAETEDGKLCFWSQAKPTAEIAGSCTLWGGSNGGTTASGGGVVPIASYDRLGIVQISSGLNITEEGELSVAVATDEEVDAMLAEIYGEEGAEV